MTLPVIADGVGLVSYSVTGALLVPQRGLIPALHLQKLKAASAPVVVGIGDSQMAVGAANQVSVQDGRWPMLMRRIREDNPTKTWAAAQFINLAIGGQGWQTINNAVSAGWPSWYFDHTIPWLLYAQAANPDTLFISLGINDTYLITPDQIKNALTSIGTWGTALPAWQSSHAYTQFSVIKDGNNKMVVATTAGTSGGGPTWATTLGGSTTDGTVTWKLMSTAVYSAKVPDLILCTNENINPTAAGYTDAQHIYGALAAAGLQRTVARANSVGATVTNQPPIGLIDIGRAFTMATTGRDPCAQILATQAGYPQTLTTFPASLPMTQGDFSITLTVPAATAAAMQTASSHLRLTVGQADTTSTSALNRYELAPSAGTVYTTYYASNGVSTATGVSATWNTATDNTIVLNAKGGHLQIIINGKTVQDAVQPRYAAPFFPTIAMSVDISASSPQVIVSGYAAGTPVRVPTPLSILTAWGGAGYAGGGNGINHPPSDELNSVVWPVLQATDFAVGP